MPGSIDRGSPVQRVAVKKKSTRSSIALAVAAGAVHRGDRNQVGRVDLDPDLLEDLPPIAAASTDSSFSTCPAGTAQNPSM